MNNHKINAMILAAGLGKRMMPLTAALPKPMLLVHGRTLIDRALDFVSAAGVDEVVVNSFYKAELLEAHLADRQKLLPNAPHITTLREAVLLETGGGIKNALPLLDTTPFLTLNSDTICVDGDVPAIARLLAAWDDTQMDALLLVHPVDLAIGYDGKGDFFIEGDGCIRRRLDAPHAPFVFTGVQLIHPRLFQGSPEGPFSIIHWIYEGGTRPDGTLLRARALIHNGDWLHVGDPDGWALAEDWFSRR